MYQLIIKPKAKKGLLKIHPNDRKKVLIRLDLLRQNPFGPLPNFVKLSGTKWSYRIKMGKLRIIYELNKEDKIITVRLIDYRKTQTYRRLWE